MGKKLATIKYKYCIREHANFKEDIYELFDFTQNWKERTKWDKQTKALGFLENSYQLKKGAKMYTESTEGVKMETEYIVFNRPNKITIKRSQLAKTHGFHKGFLKL